MAVGLPAGVLRLLLITAFAGWAGDRFVVGAPLWLRAAPTAATAYVTALRAAIAAGGRYRACP